MSVEITFEEFLVKLRGTVGWFLKSMPTIGPGLMVLRNEKQVCPVVAVANAQQDQIVYKVWQVKEAAAEIGLDYEIAELVAAAADGYEDLHSYTRSQLLATRAILLDACGLNASGMAA